MSRFFLSETADLIGNVSAFLSHLRSFSRCHLINDICWMNSPISLGQLFGWVTWQLKNLIWFATTELPSLTRLVAAPWAILNKSLKTRIRLLPHLSYLSFPSCSPTHTSSYPALIYSDHELFLNRNYLYYNRMI